MNTTTISPVAVKIDTALKNRLKRLATLRQRKPHWLMREAIAQYVEREEQREDFKKEALTAWKDYQATGKHVTGDEVIAWLETWGEKKTKPAPKCRK